MNKKLIALILLFSLGNVRCKKDDKTEIDVSQITQTDVSGNNTGTMDNTDWTKDNTWTDAEINLFETPTSSELASTETAVVANSVAYPNPITTTVMLYFNTSKVTLLQMVITDKFLTIKDRHYYTSHPGANLIQLKLDEAAYSNNTNYRVYY